jgi:hypothetical protein
LAALKHLPPPDNQDLLLAFHHLSVDKGVSKTGKYCATQTLYVDGERPLQYRRLSKWLLFLTGMFEKAASFSFVDPPIPQQRGPGHLYALVQTAEDVKEVLRRLGRHWTDDEIEIELCITLARFLTFVFSIQPASILFTTEQLSIPAEFKEKSLEQVRRELCAPRTDASDVFHWVVSTLVEVLQPRRSRCVAVPSCKLSETASGGCNSEHAQVSWLRARRQASAVAALRVTSYERHVALRGLRLLCMWR